MKIIESIIEKYDWFIYYRAFHSIRRICERNVGFAYYFELYIKKWIEQHPITPELKKATEVFFEELENKTSGEKL